MGAAVRGAGPQRGGAGAGAAGQAASVLQLAGRVPEPDAAAAGAGPDADGGDAVRQAGGGDAVSQHQGDHRGGRRVRLHVFSQRGGAAGGAGECGGRGAGAAGGARPGMQGLRPVHVHGR